MEIDFGLLEELGIIPDNLTEEQRRNLMNTPITVEKGGKELGIDATKLEVKNMEAEIASDMPKIRRISPHIDHRQSPMGEIRASI